MNKILKYDKAKFKIQEEKENKTFKIKYQEDCDILIKDSKLIKTMIDKKINKLYKRVLKICLDIIDTNDEDSGNLILTEIDKNILYVEQKYKEYLTIKELEKYKNAFELMKQGMFETLIQKQNEEKGVVR